MFKPKGIVPPIITPFDAQGNIDFDVYKQMIEHLISQGVHGLFPMGTTGEFYALTDDEYRKILQVTVEVVAGRVDVYAGANHITTRGVIRLIKICEEIPGISAISVLTPMFVSQTQDELYAYFKTIADSTDLPIILYNNPPKTNVTIAPATAAKLATLKNVIGVKDSSGDMTSALEYIRLTKDIENFSVLMGRDTLIYSGLCHGAAGAIASCANVAPRLISNIYDKYVAGDLEGALADQFALNPLRIACSMGTFPAVIKEGLVQQGFPVGKCLDPIAELTQSEKDSLHKVLADMGLVK